MEMGHRAKEVDQVNPKLTPIGLQIFLMYQVKIEEKILIVKEKRVVNLTQNLLTHQKKNRLLQKNKVTEVRRALERKKMSRRKEMIQLILKQLQIWKMIKQKRKVTQAVKMRLKVMVKKN